MATLAQLQAEPWWSREIVTAELAGLGDVLRTAWGLPVDAIGTKGNTSHLRGGHRSQEWIRNSVWCTDRSYTVQSGLTADQLRHVAAFDVTPGVWGSDANRARMITITGRIVAARAARVLPEITEVFGTLDGRTVYGGADTSHLDHLHLTFDRRQLHNADLMRRVAAVLNGDDMALSDADAKALTNRVNALIDMAPANPFGDDLKPEPNKLAEKLNALAADVAELKARPTAPQIQVDLGALAQALAGVPAFGDVVVAAVKRALSEGVAS